MNIRTFSLLGTDVLATTLWCFPWLQVGGPGDSALECFIIFTPSASPQVWLRDQSQQGSVKLCYTVKLLYVEKPTSQL